MSNPIDRLSQLVRPNILALQPYASARDEFTGHAAIFLDANENSLGSPLATDYSRYPDPQQKVLKNKLASLKDLTSNQIFIGNGSDEAIDLLLRAFVEPSRDNLLILPPTYGMYTVQANIHGAEIRRVTLLPDFSPDEAAIEAATDGQSKLLFLCSPNNPTGQCLSDEFVLRMLQGFPGLVVVDEAYIDFANRRSWSSRLDEFPNLVVLQTLSKAWGLAGLRVGMAFANPFIINILNKIKYPYNLALPTIQLAEQALEKGAEVRKKVTLLLVERERLSVELPKMPCIREIFPSDANFLLVRTTDADGIYQHLCNQGIVVRNRSREPQCAQCLRITVGSVEENDRLLEALGAY